MKYIITNKQYKLLLESSNYDDIIWLPDLRFFGDDLQTFEYVINQGKNKRLGFKGDLNLAGLGIKSLGNLEYVGGYLDLRNSDITSLGNLEYVGGYLDIRNAPIKSLGNLKHIGRYLNLYGLDIKSLGNLEYVGGNLYLKYTPLSKTTTEDEIRSKVNVVGDIYL